MDREKIISLFNIHAGETVGITQQSILFYHTKFVLPQMELQQRRVSSQSITSDATKLLRLMLKANLPNNLPPGKIKLPSLLTTLLLPTIKFVLLSVCYRLSQYFFNYQPCKYHSLLLLINFCHFVKIILAIHSIIFFNFLLSD